MKKTKMKVKCVWSKSWRMKAGKVYTAKDVCVGAVTILEITPSRPAGFSMGYCINSDFTGKAFEEFAI